VSIRSGALTVVGVMAMGIAAPTRAAEEPSSDVPVTKDLAAVIALQGMPCGKVVDATRQGEDDYVASCEDGNRYRVFVNADGRVVVEKLD
jgi:hypothetical protein